MRNNATIRSSKRKSRSRSSLRLENLEPRQLLSVLGGIGPHHQQHDYGQNNSARLAEEIVLDESGETTLDGDISSGRDRDYYSFTTENAGMITISMEALETDGSGLDSYLTIYNSRRQKVAVNDDVSSDNLDSYVEFYAEAGETYYIRADGYRNSTGSYEITLTTPITNESYGEEVDYANTVAGSIEISTMADDEGTISIDGAIYPERDQDVFTFTVETDGEYAVSMSAEDSTLDTYLYIYNENGKLVYRNDDIEKSNTDSYIEFSAEEGEVYYIRADAWKNSIGTYTLTIDNLTAPEATVDDDTVEAEDGTDTSNDTDSDSDTDGDTEAGTDDSTEVVTDTSEGWVLIIGSYDYPGFQNDLTGPRYDTELVSEIFTDYYSVSEDNIHILSGGTNVTDDAVAEEFAWLAENADADDYVVVYYSGHGSAGTSETVNDDEGLYLPDTTTIYQSDLEGWLGSINSETDKVLILDSCYAGGLLDIANNVANTAVIASTDYDLTAWDSVESYYPAGVRGRGGVFATWLNYGIMSGNADSNSNGFVTLLEAFNYADAGINNATGSNEYNQDPVINYSVDFDLAVFLS